MMDMDTALCTIADYYYFLGAKAGWNRCETERSQISESRFPGTGAFKEAMAMLNEQARQSNEPVS